jgi:hypothetical protein
MSVLGTAALIGAGITAASGIASGVGTAIGAKKERERIDDEIERIRRNRGLTAAEKSRFEAAATAEAAGIERPNKAKHLQRKPLQAVRYLAATSSCANKHGNKPAPKRPSKPGNANCKPTCNDAPNKPPLFRSFAALGRKPNNAVSAAL